jgi:Fe-S cluster assembly iron-binding protein IscA
LGLVLDEPGEDDTIFTEQGVTYIINKALLERAKPLKVDFVNSPIGSGFYISSNLKKDCRSCSC